jgi:hypothetical protein
MISTLIEAARRARAAFRRARGNAENTSVVRQPALHHDVASPRPATANPPRPQPDHAALAALVLGGLLDPVDAVFVALVEADRRRAR